MKVKDKEFEIFIAQGEIADRVREIAGQINEDYKGKAPLFLVVLNGAFMFASDLLKQVNIPCEVSCIKLSSYEGMSSTGQVGRLMGVNEDLRGRHVIIVEDIVDTGVTMEAVTAELRQAGAASMEIAALLLKPDSLKKDIKVKYTCFEIPPRFVVGYGLDYDGYGRNSADLYVLRSAE